MTYDMNNNVIRVVNTHGQTMLVGTNNVEYKEYIEVVLRFAEEVFDIEQKQWREAMSE
jgi:hypothetical protein